MSKINLDNYKVFASQGSGGGGFDYCMAQLEDCESIEKDKVKNHVMLNIVDIYSGRKEKDNLRVCNSCKARIQGKFKDLTFIPTLNEKVKLMDELFPIEEDESNNL